MVSRIKGLWSDEDGAVTVDWVVLTATLVLFIMTIVLGTIRNATSDLSNRIADQVSNAL